MSLTRKLSTKVSPQHFRTSVGAKNSKSFDIGCFSKNKKKIIIVALLAVAIATLVGILVVVFGSSKPGLRRIVAFCVCIRT